MNTSLLLLFLSFLLSSSFMGDKTTGSECDIYCVYTSDYAPIGSRGLSPDGDIVELERILTPYNGLKDGVYRVSLTGTCENYYSIDGTDLYIESTLCMDVAVSTDVVMKIWNVDGFTFGTVTFPE